MRTRSVKMGPKLWFISVVLGISAIATGCGTTGHSAGLGGFVNSRGSCFVTSAGMPWCR
jgi:cysteine synthase